MTTTYLPARIPSDDEFETMPIAVRNAVLDAIRDENVEAAK